MCIRDRIAEVHELVQQNSQFLIATHSPMLMAYPYAKLLEFSEAGIQEVSYKDTEHYQLTRRFLEQPDVYKRQLWHRLYPVVVPRV